MKNTKKRLEVFSFYDHAGISKHLEKMAEKGWMIEQMSNFGWVYHRIEPKTVKFAVSYYPKASEFDPEPTDEQKTFHEFCAHTGWKLACNSRFSITSRRILLLSKQNQCWKLRASTHLQKRASFHPIFFCCWFQLWVVAYLSAVCLATQPISLQVRLNCLPAYVISYCLYSVSQSLPAISIGTVKLKN